MGGNEGCTKGALKGPKTSPSGPRRCAKGARFLPPPFIAPPLPTARGIMGTHSRKTAVASSASMAKGRWRATCWWREPWSTSMSPSLGLGGGAVSSACSCLTCPESLAASPDGAARGETFLLLARLLTETEGFLSGTQPAKHEHLRPLQLAHAQDASSPGRLRLPHQSPHPLWTLAPPRRAASSGPRPRGPPYLHVRLAEARDAFRALGPKHGREEEMGEEKEND